MSIQPTPVYFKAHCTAASKDEIEQAFFADYEGNFYFWRVFRTTPESFERGRQRLPEVPVEIVAADDKMLKVLEWVGDDDAE